jgi:hypothetical protein
MADLVKWVATLGGPHILSPLECVAEWQGIDDSTDLGLGDVSDYARACRVQGWLGAISCGPHFDVLVLGGDIGTVGWFPDDKGGTLVTWLGCDTEEHIIKILKERYALPESLREIDEALEFETGASGSLILFDSALSGADVYSSGKTIHLEPGRHEISAAYIETPDCIIVIREIR